MSTILMIDRPEDWPERLADYLARPFVFSWGECDCCTFAADWVAALSGIDPMAEFRGRYNTALSAVRALRDCGYDSISAAIDARLYRIDPITLTRRGDVVCRTFDDSGETIGICAGQYSAFLTESGLIYVPTLDCDHSWRVG